MCSINDSLLIFILSLSLSLSRIRQPAYHSRFNEEDCKTIASFPLLPIKTDIRGPAPPASKDEKDIIDEAIFFFRANVLFKNYDIRGDADKLMCYLTLCIQQLIKALVDCKSKAEASTEYKQLIHDEKFKIPGDKGFPLKNFCEKPSSSSQADKLRSYLKQVRSEMFQRVFAILYAPDGTKNKWWFGFYKQEFMGMSL